MSSFWLIYSPSYANIPVIVELVARLLYVPLMQIPHPRCTLKAFWKRQSEKQLWTQWFCRKSTLWRCPPAVLLSMLAKTPLETTVYLFLPGLQLLLILVLLFVRYFWVADAEKVPPLCGIRPPLCLFMQERHPSLLVSCVFSLILFTFHSGLHQRTWNRLSSPKPFQLKGVCLFSF